MRPVITKEKINTVMGKALIVMNKTISELMSLRRLSVVLIAGLVPPILFGIIWRESFQSGTFSLEMQTQTMIGYFMLISFMWIVGIYIAYAIIVSGMDSVSKEEEGGTLLLMVSKPISRFQFIFGKFLGLLVTTLVLDIVILFASIFIFWILLGLDPKTVSALLGLVFWIFLYSIIVATLFDALAIAVSTLLKSQVLKAALSIILVMLIFGLGPILRAAWPSTYDNYHLIYIDPGYHLGNVYVSAVEQAESGRMTPQIQAYMGIFTGAYEAGIEEAMLAMFTGSSKSFDPDIDAMPPSLERTDYLHPLLSMLLCLIASAATMGIAKVAIERKEVY